jgi:DNA-binding GntR family transcriptional regulator
VSVYPRRGTFASMVDITDLAEIAEIRSRLEPLAALRAAKHASTQDRAQMSALAVAAHEVVDAGGGVREG